MAIEEVKHSDLQKAVKDIAAVLDIKQNHVAGRQVLIDFIVNTIGGCIGPNPENPEEQIWVDERAGNLKPDTLATYEALSTPAAETEQPGPSAAVVQQSPEVAAAEAAGQPDPKETAMVQDGASEVLPQGVAPKECPEFGKGYDPEDPACSKPCKRAEECQTVMAEAKAAAPTGRKPKKTAEEKETEKQAKAAEREAKKQAKAAEREAKKQERAAAKPIKEKRYTRADAFAEAIRKGGTMTEILTAQAEAYERNTGKKPSATTQSEQWVFGNYVAPLVALEFVSVDTEGRYSLKG